MTFASASTTADRHFRLEAISTLVVKWPSAEPHAALPSSTFQ